jgi:hypothetical protein
MAFLLVMMSYFLGDVKEEEKNKIETGASAGPQNMVNNPDLHWIDFVSTFSVEQCVFYATTSI